MFRLGPTGLPQPLLKLIEDLLVRRQGGGHVHDLLLGKLLLDFNPDSEGQLLGEVLRRNAHWRLGLDVAHGVEPALLQVQCGQPLPQWDQPVFHRRALRAPKGDLPLEVHEIALNASAQSMFRVCHSASGAFPPPLPILVAALSAGREGRA